MKTLIAFDLDGTLAESKQPIQPPMATLLKELLDVASVAVISGGDWPQFETQVVGQLPKDARFEKLFIMPTTGAKLFRYQDGKWTTIYAENFTPEERDRIIAAFDEGIKAAGIGEERTWGERLEDRGAQITFSGLGQEAPLEAKKAWDPDFAKRKRLQEVIGAALPDLSVKIGGSTSIDITREGIDKAYAMRRLEEHSGIPGDAMLFLGDAIYPGGNDDPVRAAGYDTLAVRDVQETRTAVAAVIHCLKQ